MSRYYYNGKDLKVVYSSIVPRFAIYLETINGCHYYINKAKTKVFEVA